MFELVKSYVQDAAAEQISVTNPLASGTSPWLKSARSGDRTLQHTPSMRDYYQMSRSSSSQEQLVPPSPGDEGQPVMWAAGTKDSDISSLDARRKTYERIRQYRRMQSGHLTPGVNRAGPRPRPTKHITINLGQSEPEDSQPRLNRGRRYMDIALADTGESMDDDSQRRKTRTLDESSKNGDSHLRRGFTASE
ncbi:hypothetical protein Pmar_PMAR002409 [Perkinsus marinus ATCC 50983]|uniref:Uncharacterized protein n=1 Tax=Perkinsus marinus (strain ATCC 50983 / TXsc) TaxID=423536 RepID=C5LYV6_PERM5|nr:hypothetical protein Pmar_PMAR002409 [Perkinsus marinus ATCC 50983]EEQ98130.1 hypothetical protein Pmar_PMAR002409 [Perkinsus marinus ATCC 50983]|eukprot:XP_002765413.1 hypothetical protein Pmar_PMAR002409 [Perkinsus marinus ATCC 50983]